MEIAELKAFIAVAELGSFSQAALQLHLTQPAVSKRINQLEITLGCQLFDRIGRQVALTEAGRDLLPRANRILLEMDDMRRSLSNLNGEVSGTLKIGTSHHIGLHRLPPILKRFTQRYPQVFLDIQFIDSELAFDLVTQGKLELGIVTLPPDQHSNVRTRAIWQDQLVFMVGLEHPLAGETLKDLEQLTNHPAILPSMTTFTRRIVESLFQQKKLRIDVPISTNYLETIKMMTSIGLGWTVLPKTMLDETVTPFNVKGVQLERTLGVVYHEKHSLSNAARAILDLITQAEQSSEGQSNYR
ncbi:LysR family transcriptional regulator [Ketobacter sp. MCCC 1A13808]|uniref:LysR family transcriptional regulator n=1 Tax=Ketobacter sp. MCCC 1A13808 TaxID=2602738 RepID=UPI0012EB4F96|nr:LysR family transcriptional regulator [Ketobacter sp. MCCC 1A13808]MVF12471.1 LysR family transcriptional regulator [Ketobacter sp. MCCC 1A13808]